MKASDYFIPTLREVPAEAQIASHQLLLRAGYIRQLGAGVYTYLPIAWRTLRKIEQIIREEMDAMNCLEMRMPTLQQKELLEETGRWNVDVVYKLKDRRDADFALGFTHEEVMTDIARRDMRSWRDLPRLLYQIQTKFRDEPRPRGGTIRTREFTMYDGYSFDRDDEGMDVSYWKFYRAYVNAFSRMGLAAISVEADGGAIGDLDNHEFMTLSEAGEDTVLRCPNCLYAANVERCAVVAPESLDPATFREKPLEIVSTPGARTIREVAGLLGTAETNLVKTLIYVADGTPVAVLLRGDRTLNEIKLKRLIRATDFALADDATVERLTTAPVGFAGPVGLNDVRIIADNALIGMGNFITGANQADAHFVHVNVGRDFTPSEFADIAEAMAGDLCPNCKIGHLEDVRGIEVGHIFKLGTKYSGPMSANYSAEQGTMKPILMGSYGIGITRLLAALVEASHDDNGIIWHPSVAPFHVAIIAGNYKDVDMYAAALALHDELTARGVEVMFDDRDERPGPKFKDADLIGYPVRVVVGKGLAAGNLELRSRKDPASGRDVPVAEAADAVVTLLAELGVSAPKEAPRR